MYYNPHSETSGARSTTSMETLPAQKEPPELSFISIRARMTRFVSYQGTPDMAGHLEIFHKDTVGSGIA